MTWAFKNSDFVAMKNMVLSVTGADVPAILPFLQMQTVKRTNYFSVYYGNGFDLTDPT